jgi:hypothetical protein
MYEGIDTVVLHNELAYHDQLPVDWLPRPQGFDSYALAGMDEANISLLHACVSAEEQPVRDKHDELLPLANELARLDYKLNLILQLLGSLVPRDQPAALSDVRFNTLGASWHATGQLPELGAIGTLRIRLRSALPEALTFACEVTDTRGGEISVRYLQLSERCAELVQRLCFLRHRKEVAGARKSRAS